MAKLRIVVTATLEYETDPQWYPDASTPEEMLAIDLENAKGDVLLFLDNSNTKWEFKGEVIS